MVVTLEEALVSLLGRPPGPDRVTDLLEAATEAMRRRERNSADGEAVFVAIGEIVASEDDGLSWREVERRTGVPKSTAHKWGTPPPRTPTTEE